MRLFCLATALITANAFAGEKVLLRLNLKQDQRFEYQVKLQMDFLDLGSVKGIFHVAERTTAVTPTGYTQNIYLAGNSVSATGKMDSAKKSLEELKNVSQRRIVFPTGKFKATAGPDGSIFGSAIDLVFSEQPVEVGDNWIGKFEPDDQLGELEMIFKLVSLTPDEAKVEGSLKENETFKTAEPYTFIVDRKTGRTKYAHGSIKATTSSFTMIFKHEMRMIVPSQPYQFQSGDM